MQRNPPTDRALNDDNILSVSAARLLWCAIRDLVYSGQPTDFAPDYFFGFSHACMLCLVISPGEWEVVKNRMGDMRAREFSHQTNVAFLGAIRAPSQQP
jgi:hypothetical protein